jgi:hypothetical protein
VLACDGCHRQFDDAHEYLLHFESAEQARADAAEQAADEPQRGWTRDGERDLCQRCTCQARGHDWRRFLPYDPQVPPYQTCERCDRIEDVPGGEPR